MDVQPAFSNWHQTNSQPVFTSQNPNIVSTVLLLGKGRLLSLIYINGDAVQLFQVWQPLDHLKKGQRSGSHEPEHISHEQDSPMALSYIYKNIHTHTHIHKLTHTVTEYMETCLPTSLYIRPPHENGFGQPIIQVLYFKSAIPVRVLAPKQKSTFRYVKT